jgi:CheY-like chemotaxis protein
MWNRNAYMKRNHPHIAVLLVEDDLDDIFMVQRAFKKAHIPNPLQIVTDGEQATSFLQGEGKYADRHLHPLPQLIVMDLKMPRKSGFEMLEWIKNDSHLRRIPVVIVSSSDEPSDINRAYELGANAYMVKPMDFRAVENLFQSITRYWGVECAKPELEAEPHPHQA